MILLLVSICMILLGIVLIRRYFTEEIGFIIVSVFTIVVLMQLVLLGKRHGVRVNMEKREVFRQTLKNARDNNTYLENATILKEISDWNQWVKEVQMDNEFWFDMYIPDEVDTMTYLK